MSRPARKPFALPRAPPRKPLPGAGGRVGAGARGTEDGYLYVAGVRDASKRITEFRTDSDVCPICQTDRQFNKSLRLLVSPCYHKMCESCIDRLFTLGPEPCPTCGKILRKANFAHQTFEDLRVEKEVAVRRRMAEYFNKREEDFATSREYDDYLEDVENLTFNLLNDVDLVETERRIAQYAKQNAATIAANQEKTALEALSQAERDEIEKRAREERMRMVEEAERVERVEDERVKAEIVDALAKGSTLRAEEIRRAHEAAKAARALNLSASLPRSLFSEGNIESEEVHTPLSPSYGGVYVPIPYSDPETAVWTGWYAPKNEYADGRSGVLAVKEDKDGTVRPGGYDLKLFWEMEIRTAVESLGVEPLTHELEA